MMKTQAILLVVGWLLLLLGIALPLLATIQTDFLALGAFLTAIAMAVNATAMSRRGQHEAGKERQP